MTERLPASPNAISDEISASWLTATLRAAGHLMRGEVTALTVEPWRTKRLSTLYRLHAAYSANVDLPTRFVLKLSRTVAQSSVAKRRRWKEHEFYTRLVPAMADAPVPRHFATRLSPAAGSALLLLEDLSARHTKPPPAQPPTFAALQGDVDCLACLHAAWWGDAELCQAALTRDDAWIEEKTEATRRLLSRFLAQMGGQLFPVTRQALDAVGAAWPSLLRRSTELPLTVVHGDAHPWNFLTPLDTHRDRTLLLDWEAWSIEAGPHDLASLIALHLPEAMRAELEEELLRQYVARLRQHGVVDYDLTTCHDDYRRAIARRVISPVSMWSRGSKERVWRPMLERITAAYHDLHCAELLLP